MGMIGRALIRRGDNCYYLHVGADGLTIAPAQAHSVYGSFIPSEWQYDLELAGPDTSANVRRVDASEVIHARYAINPETPWRGYGPIQRGNRSWQAQC